MRENGGFRIFLVIAVGLTLAATNSWGGMGGGGPGGGGGGGYGPGPGGGTVYDANFTSVHFSGSGNCSMCHNGLYDASGKDVSIETDWSSAMMANSTRDPLWKAKLRSELNRNPLLAETIKTINNKCTRCHAPMANYEADFLGDYISALDDYGFLDPSNLHYDEAIDGVSCTLCHQVQDSNLGTLAGFSGDYTIETYTNPVDRSLFGQYPDVFAQPMRNNVQYTPAYSTHVHESKVCAVCHNLKTPYVDENGNKLSTTPESEFPEQMPYSEWEHSAYVDQQSCQDCHMPQTNGVTISSRPMWLSPRDNFAIHEFAGGNLMMLDILNNNRSSLGVTSNNFAETIAATSGLLQGAANIELAHGSLTNGQLDFALKINSFSGHKLPTGIPLRRIILNVKVKNKNGQIVFESGRINPDGSVEGLDSDIDSRRYESHYNLITSPDQVQVYETIMEDSSGAVTYTLLEAMKYAKDNRLIPQGFNKANAGSDIMVVGAAADDEDFGGDIANSNYDGSDKIRFQIAGMNAARYNVTAELVFQPLAYAVLKNLTQDTDAEITTFNTMFNASSQKSVVINTLQFEVKQ